MIPPIVHESQNIVRIIPRMAGENVMNYQLPRARVKRPEQKKRRNSERRPKRFV